LGSLGRRHNRNHFKLDQVAPARDPRVEELRVFRFHQLKTSSGVKIDPTVEVAQPLG